MKRYIVLLLLIAMLVTLVPGVSALAQDYVAPDNYHMIWSDPNENKLIDINKVLISDNGQYLMLAFSTHRPFTKTLLANQRICFFLDTDQNRSTGMVDDDGFDCIIELKDVNGTLFLLAYDTNHGDPLTAFAASIDVTQMASGDIVQGIVPLSWFGDIEQFDWKMEVFEASTSTTRPPTTYDKVPNSGYHTYTLYKAPSTPPSTDTNTPGGDDTTTPTTIPSGGGGGGGGGTQLLDMLKADPEDKEIAEEQTQKKNFGDVTLNDWFYNYVRAMVDTDVVTGYDDGTFKPNRQITRAEFSKMVCLAKGWDLESSSTPPSFNDVGQNHWAFRYIETARNRGAIAGYPDGSFGPNKNITRAELCKIICLANNYNLSQGPCDFSDCGEHWALRYMVTAKVKAIVSGYKDGTFKPDGPATRAEVCKMLYQMLQE